MCWTTSAISRSTTDSYQSGVGNRHKEVASCGGNDYGARMRIAIASDHAALDLFGVQAADAVVGATELERPGTLQGLGLD